MSVHAVANNQNKKGLFHEGVKRPIETEDELYTRPIINKRTSD